MKSVFQVRMGRRTSTALLSGCHSEENNSLLTTSIDHLPVCQSTQYIAQHATELWQTDPTRTVCVCTIGMGTSRAKGLCIQEAFLPLENASPV